LQAGPAVFYLIRLYLPIALERKAVVAGFGESKQKE
jgi:hypothetical protein